MAFEKIKSHNSRYGVDSIWTIETHYQKYTNKL